MEIQFISRFLSKCINKTYYPITCHNNFQVTPQMVHRSILAIRFGCRTLADPSGRKRNSIAFVENLLLRNRLASKASFPELFRQSLLKCSNVYAILNTAIDHAQISQEHDITRLLDELGCYSYHSGLAVTD